MGWMGALNNWERRIIGKWRFFLLAPPDLHVWLAMDMHDAQRLIPQAVRQGRGLNTIRERVQIGLEEWRSTGSHAVSPAARPGKTPRQAMEDGD